VQLRCVVYALLCYVVVLRCVVFVLLCFVWCRAILAVGTWAELQIWTVCSKEPQILTYVSSLSVRSVFDVCWYFGVLTCFVVI